MKRFILLVIFLATLTALFSQQNDPPQDNNDKTVYHTASLYVYDKTRLLISETDLIGTFYVAPKENIKTYITGAALMNSGQLSYSDRDEIFLNVGKKDGFQEGDQFLIIAEGKQIKHHKTRKKLGYFYMRKGIAEITCLYEDKSIALLSKINNPVEIGDFLIPYEPEDVVKGNEINYTRCRLPQTKVKDEVVYICTLTGIARMVAGPNDLVVIGLSNAFVSKGDFVLFYKELKPELPPIAIGSGIVLNAQNMSSTVKILEASESIGVATKLLLMPKDINKDVKTDEKVPIIKTLDQESEDISNEEESIDREIIFTLDAKTIEEQQMETILNEIKEFVDTKSSFIIILRGHTCSIGGEEYNLKLSQSRVEFIKSLLMKKLEIDDKFIESYFYGEKDAPYDNTTEGQRRKNRLVSIQVIGK